VLFFVVAMASSTKHEWRFVVSRDIRNKDVDWFIDRLRDNGYPLAQSVNSNILLDPVQEKRLVFCDKDGKTLLMPVNDDDAIWKPVRPTMGDPDNLMSVQRTGLFTEGELDGLRDLLRKTFGLVEANGKLFFRNGAFVGFNIGVFGAETEKNGIPARAYDSVASMQRYFTTEKLESLSKQEKSAIGTLHRKLLLSVNKVECRALVDFLDACANQLGTDCPTDLKVVVSKTTVFGLHSLNLMHAAHKGVVILRRTSATTSGIPFHFDTAPSKTIRLVLDDACTGGELCYMDKNQQLAVVENKCGQYTEHDHTLWHAVARIQPGPPRYCLFIVGADRIPEDAYMHSVDMEPSH
jgi:hypothetical protein